VKLLDKRRLFPSVSKGFLTVTGSMCCTLLKIPLQKLKTIGDAFKLYSFDYQGVTPFVTYSVVFEFFYQKSC
jgi:uncharacterized membrane protein YkgB